MELTSKQRAQLRGMAANLDTIVHVGKDGIGDNWSSRSTTLWRPGSSSRAGCWKTPCTPPGRRQRS